MNFRVAFFLFSTNIRGIPIFRRVVVPDTITENEKDHFSKTLAHRLSELLIAHGTPANQQVNLLTRLCSLSVSQARRKLLGASWSFEEVLAVARHCGISLDSLFPGNATDTVGFTSDLPAENTAHATLPVDVLLGNFRGTGKARLGASVSKPDQISLIAIQTTSGWKVGTPEDIAAHDPNAHGFQVEELLIQVPLAHRPHIAIVDDDTALAKSLAEWFDEAGFKASAFTSGEAFAKVELAEFDGFVIDFLLDGGDSSQPLIHRIREALPHAPIILLTGKLRNGSVSEADLMGVLRTSNVIFYEKPVRPGMLAAALQNGLDNLGSSQK